ncbi:hypothetical protein Tco_1298047 [Tanacetum coccineum]
MTCTSSTRQRGGSKKRAAFDRVQPPIKKVRTGPSTTLPMKGKHIDKNTTKLDECLAALDIEFDNELFPNMLKALALKMGGQRRGLEFGVVHDQAGKGLENIDSYDAECKDKYELMVMDLKNFIFPILESLEVCKDSVIKFLMSSLTSEGIHNEEDPLVEFALFSQLENNS